MPRGKHLEYEICSAWTLAVGPEISCRTRPLRAPGGRLVVATENTIWATELGYMGEELKDKLNAALGREAVREVRFVAKPDESKRAGADPGDSDESRAKTTQGKAASTAKEDI